MRRGMRVAGAGLAGLVMSVVAGCGGSDSAEDRMASAGGGDQPAATATASTGAGDVAKWAQCLREHGLDVQDPPPGGTVTLPMDGPGVDDAVQKCKQYQTATQGRTGFDPADPAQRERQRTFAKCMRDNGVDWPDPVPGQPATAPAMTPQLMDVFTKCSKDVPVTDGDK